MASTVRLADFSDRELLFVFSDHEDDEGYVHVAGVLAALDLDNEHPARCLGARMAWLRRYGALDREEGRWHLTEVGQAVIAARLRAPAQRALDGLDAAHLVVAVESLAACYRAINGAGEAYRILTRREWQHGVRR